MPELLATVAWPLLADITPEDAPVGIWILVGVISFVIILYVILKSASDSRERANMSTMASSAYRRWLQAVKANGGEIPEYRSPISLEPGEECLFFSAKKVGKDWWPICAIMQGTGLRYGDVAMMEWSEIQGDVIRLKPNKTRRHGISVAIPIVGAVREALDSLVRRGDFLFPLHAEYYQNKKSRSQKDAGLAFREVLDLAGITGEGYSIHSWRHTAATRLAEAGADIETRKRILGHTEDVTARRYDHDEHLDETRRAIEQALAS